MSPFLGTHNYAVDHKGRLSIPASMRTIDPRKRALETFVLAYGFDGCLALYPMEEWARVEERLRRIPMGARKGRALQRMFLKDATVVSVDKQGRITIPPALKDRAGLDKEAVLHGVLNRIEIWNPDRLNRELAEGEAQVEALAEEILKDE
jgi:MraZ protein